MWQRALGLSRQPDFSGFINTIQSNPELRRQAVSAVGSSHGGGLDDMFTAYLARKAPGELPTHADLKRWIPSALQRIEGLQEQLRTGNLDAFEAKKRVAEILAARKLTGARHAGALQHADEKLNKKPDPKALNAKAQELETCLHLLTGDETQQLIRKARDGHGGAMMERFKEMNKVANQKQRVMDGLSAEQQTRIDPALVMTTYTEAAKNPAAQLDESNAMKAAAELRKRQSYKDFMRQAQEENGSLLAYKRADELYADFVSFHNQRQAKNPDEALPGNLLEQLGENEVQRQDTRDILDMNNQELLNKGVN